MIAITIYETATGRITRVRRGPTAEEVIGVLAPGEAYVLGAHDALTVHLVGGVPTARTHLTGVELDLYRERRAALAAAADMAAVDAVTWAWPSP